MDGDMSSATIIAPHIHETLSSGLVLLKDRFLLDDAECGFQSEPLSPLFQFTDIPEITDYQEIVSSSHEHANTDTHLRMEDSDLYANDLFSFVLDGSVPADCQSISLGKEDIKQSLTTAFDECAFKNSKPSPNFEIPMDLLDLLDSTNVCLNSSENCASRKLIASAARHNSETSSSSPSFTVNFDQIGDMVSSEEDYYDSQEDDYNEQKTPNYSNKTKKTQRKMSAISISLHNEDLAHGKPGQRLVLTNEEKRLLNQMGIGLPARFPLTRGEERSLRTVRRKIRNKLSAKASRARRQEYLSTLENRVSSCHKENHRLRTRIAELENDKQGLVTSMRKMRSYLARLLSGAPGSLTKEQPPLLPLTVPTQPKKQQNPFTQAAKSARTSGTSLLMVAFMILASATILPLPDFNSTELSQMAQGQAKAALLDSSLPVPASQSVPGRSRVLFSKDAPVDVSNELSPGLPHENKDFLKKEVKTEEPLSPIPKVGSAVPGRGNQLRANVKFEPNDEPDPFLFNIVEDL